MYNETNKFSCPYYVKSSMDRVNSVCEVCKNHQCPYYVNTQMINSYFDYPFSNLYNQYVSNADYDSDYDDDLDNTDDMDFIEIMDYGPEPFVVDINEITQLNDTFRTALWTGTHLQVTLMSIEVGDEIGLELHDDLDQFLRIEEGEGVVQMGDSSDRLDFQERVSDDFAIMIPAGKWHNLINTGDIPLKLYSIYAPPQHPQGTIHETKEDAMAAEENHNR